VKSLRLFKSVLGVLACMFLVHADNLTVTFTSTGFSGGYDVVAWIENGTSAFVKTAAKWGKDQNDLTPWSSLSKSTVDATSGATQSSTKSLSASWNGTNLSETPVANGSYYFCLCGGPDGGPFPLSRTAFTFNGTSKTVTGTSTNFTNISIKITGTGVAIVFPPIVAGKSISGNELSIKIGSRSIIIPFGEDNLVSVSLFDLNGSLVLKRDIVLKTGMVFAGVSLIDQKPGTYVASIKTNRRTIMQKIVVRR
jgi:hypothetical protein